MATSITTKISLDGEKEYKRAISEINSALGVMQSEMRKTSAEYQDNADSMDALHAKGDVLDRTLATQQEKVEALRQALQNAGESFGEADKRTKYWQMSLNKAEAAVYDTESAIRKNHEALEDASEKANGFSGSLMESLGISQNFGDAIGGVADKLGVQLPNGVTNALNGLGKMNAGTAAAVAGFGALAAAVVAAEKALIDITKESAAYADNILTLSQQTGLSAKTLQEFSYSAELLDVDVGTVQQSLTRLTNNMQNAINGTGDAVGAFQSLGVSLTDTSGNMRQAEDVFYEIIDRLGELENATERDALAMDIFGRSAQDLNPLIVQGTETMRALAEEAEDTGYVLDDLALQRLGAVDDAMQRLEKQTEATKNAIAAEFAPYLEESLGDIRGLIQQVGRALVDSGAVDAFGAILESATALLGPIGALASAVLPALEIALDPVVRAILLLADVADVITGLLTLDFDKVGTALGFNISKGQMSHQQSWEYRNATKSSVYDPTTGMWVGNGGYNAAGTDFWRGGWTWVGENGPERVYLPRGSQVQNAQESRRSSGDIINVYVDAKNINELQDLIRIAKNAKFRERME